MSGIVRVKCISLWQPWASLMLTDKFLETRSRDTQVRGVIYIHASKTKAGVKEMIHAPGWWVDKVEESLGVCADNWATGLPYGGIIGKADLVGTMPTERALKEFPEQDPFGDFSPGRWAHEYVRREPLPFIPVRGMQGFFYAEIPKTDAQEDQD